MRLRCVGAEGAGHSAWSEPVSVSTPGAPPRSEAVSGSLSDGALGPIVNATATKRDRARRRKNTSGEEESDAGAHRPRGQTLADFLLGASPLRA